MNLDEHTIDNATHYLRCRHCIGRNGFDYVMPCKLIKKTKSGKLCIVVFGDRYWSGKDHIKRIRYVWPHQIDPKHRPATP